MSNISAILEIVFPEAIVEVNKEDIERYYNPYLDRIYYSYKIIIENRKYLLKIIEINESIISKNNIISSLTLPNDEIIFKMDRISMIRLLFEKLK
jgi:hypothetical protein